MSAPLTSEELADLTFKLRRKMAKRGTVRFKLKDVYTGLYSRACTASSAKLALQDLRKLGVVWNCGNGYWELI